MHDIYSALHDQLQGVQDCFGVIFSCQLSYRPKMEKVTQQGKESQENEIQWISTEEQVINFYTYYSLLTLSTTLLLILLGGPLGDFIPRFV